MACGDIRKAHYLFHKPFHDGDAIFAGEVEPIPRPLLVKFYKRRKKTFFAELLCFAGSKAAQTAIPCALRATREAMQILDVSGLTSLRDLINAPRTTAVQP